MPDTSGQSRSRKKSSSRVAIAPPLLAGGATVPAEYLAHLLEVARRFKVRPELLIRGTGITLRGLDEPHAMVSRGSFMLVAERALAFTREPGLGYYNGLSLKLSSHGALGMLAMTSGTLRDVVKMVQRFVQLRAMELSLSSRIEGDEFVLEFENHVPQHLQVFFAESMFMMLHSVARALVGHPIAARFEMAFAEPAHFRRFAHLVPAGVRFGVGVNRIRMPRSVLDEAVVTSDTVMARRIERDCLQELSALQKHASILIAVRRQLRPEAREYPSLEQVAERLGSSTRTLKRRLAEQGISYRGLVDDVRRERATTLLRTTALPLEEIAAMLGYSDVASLHRSFRRWFKGSPGAYRRRDE